MKNFLITVLILIFTVSCQNSTESEKKSDEPVAKKAVIKIAFSIGEVTIKDKTDTRKAILGEILEEGSTIITGEKSTADLTFFDTGIIHIAENSTLSVSEISPDADGTTGLDMPTGKAALALSKLKNGDLKIKTPTMVAAVRGTAFVIETTKTGSAVSVVQGAVETGIIDSGTEKSNITVMTNAGEKTTVKTSDISAYTSAKKELKPVKMKRPDIVIASKELGLIEANRHDLDPETVEYISEEPVKSIEKLLEESEKSLPSPTNDKEESIDTSEIDKAAREAEAKRLKEERRKKRIEAAKESAIAVPAM
ncbi:MAG TPA: FecR domain-containing protein [Spirochaetota bacterium]|nr:FecR domain-containing protein [Spirochaetota bacterium]